MAHEVHPSSHNSTAVTGTPRLNGQNPQVQSDGHICSPALTMQPSSVVVEAAAHAHTMRVVGSRSTFAYLQTCHFSSAIHHCAFWQSGSATVGKRRVRRKVGSIRHNPLRSIEKSYSHGQFQLCRFMTPLLSVASSAGSAARIQIVDLSEERGSVRNSL